STGARRRRTTSCAGRDTRTAGGARGGSRRAARVRRRGRSEQHAVAIDGGGEGERQGRATGVSKMRRHRPRALAPRVVKTASPHASRNSKAFFTNAWWYWKTPPCPASS